MGIVSPGDMGAAIGPVIASGGARVVATTADRSERTQRIAEGLTLLPTLAEVVGESAIVFYPELVDRCRPAGRVS